MEKQQVEFGHIDELILEYMMFRGFTRSFQCFAKERQQDPLHEFEVKEILIQIISCINDLNIDGFFQLWEFYHQRLFSHVDESYSKTILDFKRELQQYYLIQAVHKQQQHHVIQFFQQHSQDLVGQSSTWREWAMLPFVPHPQQDPYFQPFFRPEWSENLFLSLENFFNLLFRNLPLPRLLALQVTKVADDGLKMQLQAQKAECDRLRVENARLLDQHEKLKGSGQQLHHQLTNLTAFICAQSYSTPSSVKLKWSKEHADEQKKQWMALFNLDTSSSINSAEPQEHPYTELHQAHNQVIKRCKFSVDGEFVATHAGTEFKVWGVAETLRGIAIDKVSSEVHCIDWTGQEGGSQIIVCGGGDGSVRCWDVRESNRGRQINVWSELPIVLDIVCGPKSNCFVSRHAKSLRASAEKIGVWDFTTEKLIRTLDGETTISNALALDFEDEKLVALGDTTGGVRVFDLRQATVAMEWKAHEDSITEVTINSPQHSIFTVGLDEHVSEWCMRTNQPLTTGPVTQYLNTAAASNSRRRLAFNSTRSHFLLSAGPKQIDASYYRIGNGTPLNFFQGHRSRVVSVDWHPFTANVITATEDASLRLWRERR